MQWISGELTPLKSAIGQKLTDEASLLMAKGANINSGTIEALLYTTCSPHRACPMAEKGAKQPTIADAARNEPQAQCRLRPLSGT